MKFLLGLLFSFLMVSCASAACPPTLALRDANGVVVQGKYTDDGSGNCIVNVLPSAGAASGGLSPLKLNALTNSAVSVKASAGQLFVIQCGNTNSTEIYVQVFNVASGSVSVGSTVPTLSIPIAASSTGGFAMSWIGLQFSTAISVAATTTATGGSAPAIALDCNAAFN